MNAKKAVYFNGLTDADLMEQEANLDPVISKNDILSISVSSLNPEASIIFNLPNMPGAITTGTSNMLGQAAGYLVDQDGYIQFPVLGQIKAAGITKKEFTRQLVQQLTDRKLLSDPVITVRQLNFHVTVLGEVGRPASITVPNEKINIMEALGLAGDLTIYAKRDNILLIREEAGKKIIRRINLNKSDVLTAPYYQLKSNDIIYAEPNNAKVSSTSQGRQILPLILSGLSVAVIVLDRLIN
ncbi:polysaccharide biosynthesis/export family protein [Cnuella takakiae]|uniref:polysaccharide biosynthesis/export family protein n=1 Tax=Cnuella takakiae TaxID=1302690 RepID=UPI001FE4DE08|nr:polysaccharide biosynthesis/export family protein [Cnuella takakiae]